MTTTTVTQTSPVLPGRNTPAARNYTNARRAGRTRPGLIEVRDPLDCICSPQVMALARGVFPR
jgi:hypothetical protein